MRNCYSGTSWRCTVLIGGRFQFAGCCIERFLCVLRGCSCNWPAKSNLLVYFSFFFLHNRYQGVCRQSNAICCSFGCALSSWTSSLLRCARNKLCLINPTFFLHCTDFVPSIWEKLRGIIRLMKDILPSNFLICFPLTQVLALRKCLL